MKNQIHFKSEKEAYEQLPEISGCKNGLESLASEALLAQVLIQLKGGKRK